MQFLASVRGDNTRVGIVWSHLEALMIAESSVVVMLRIWASPYESRSSVLMNGVDISMLEEDELARLRSDQVGFVFQAHYLLDEFTCLENALMPLTIRQGEASDDERERILRLLKRVGLEDQIHKRPDEMSGGQNQRNAIVRALANAPRIILADEPTGNLDSHSGHEVFELMREMNRESGVAFVMITHDDRLAQAADRILLIEDGLIHEISRRSTVERVTRIG